MKQLQKIQMETRLRPVDPNDPSKGYVPPTPENPTERELVITYEKDSQKATETYVVEGTGTVTSHR